MLGAGQLLGPRRESKGAAMYEFACACFTAPQGEYREPGLQENLVRDFTGRRRPPRNLNFMLGAGQLLGPRREAKGRSDVFV